LAGRSFVTGVFAEFEAVRINYDAATTARTGLRGGWGAGLRLGVDFKDWVPLHGGIRVVSANDDRPFSQWVRHCRARGRWGTGELFDCDQQPHLAVSRAGALLAFLETGIEPNFRLVKGAVWSPAMLLGYSAPIANYRRSISQCRDCKSEPVDLRARGVYGAVSLRFTWWALGIAFRYERFFGGEQRDALALALDIGLRHKAIPWLRGQ
jgi:hypothetical protein